MQGKKQTELRARLERKGYSLKSYGGFHASSHPGDMCHSHMTPKTTMDVTFLINPAACCVHHQGYINLILVTQISCINIHSMMRLHYSVPMSTELWSQGRNVQMDTWVMGHFAQRKHLVEKIHTQHLGRRKSNGRLMYNYLSSLLDQICSCT